MKGKLLLALVLCLPLVLQAGRKPKAEVKEGEVDGYSVQLVYELTYTYASIGRGEKIKEVPKVKVYFVEPPLSQHTDKLPQGRQFTNTWSTPAQHSEHKAFIQRECVLVAQERRDWQLWCDSASIGPLYSGFLMAIDYANTLCIGHDEEVRIFEDVMKDYKCRTTGPCDWKDWKPPTQ